MSSFMCSSYLKVFLCTRSLSLRCRVSRGCVAEFALVVLALLVRFAIVVCALLIYAVLATRQKESFEY